ncbi:MAG: YbaB/EbfC family nucleoid-associated protein [Alkalispirochaeta sp.]
MNPMDLLKNMGQLQETMQEAQKRLKETKVTGTAGGDMIRIEMNGEFTVLSVEIAPEVIDPEDREMLQDLFRAAHNDASGKVRAALQENLSSLAGGMQIPPGLFGGA